jgi:Enoyl-CoA hydratase/isomerase
LKTDTRGDDDVQLWVPCLFAGRSRVHQFGKPVSHLYEQVVRILQTSKPIIAAVHGAAIGGGLGVACVADFRITCPEARFAANFTRLGFHPGFGLTVLLRELVGKNQTELLSTRGAGSAARKRPASAWRTVACRRRASGPKPSSSRRRSPNARRWPSSQHDV